MATLRSDQRPGLIGPPPEDVRVTVTVLPRRRGAWVRRRLGHLAPRASRRLAIGLLVVSMVVALGLNLFLAQRHQAQRGASPSASRCLSALATLDRGHGDFYRSVWCERYAGRHAAGSYRFVGAPLPAFDSAGG